jgi:hypothetical protein
VLPPSQALKVHPEGEEYPMRKVLSVFIAVCLVLSLCTGVFVSVLSAKATTAPVLVAGITVTSEGFATTVMNGKTLQMNATVLPTNATDPSVIWLVGNAEGTATIDASTGILTGTSVGRVIVEALAHDGSGIKGYQAITVSTKEQAVIVLQIGKSTFTVNGISNGSLDSPPIIKNGRTLVPIRTIIEALKGSIGWDGTTRKATVTLGSTTIELWIGKNVATVNGKNTPIDSTNALVVPEIISSRTMLPLRFVSENLGCSVVWATATKTITITYMP